MKKTFPILVLLFVLLTAFKSDNKELEFGYPKNKNAVFFLKTDKFKKFTKEWRGADYYYMSENGKDGFICSVLFYKLNEEEQKFLVDTPKLLLNAPDISPAYPFSYFTANSNLKNVETNTSKWGSMTDDFMFSHSHVKEYAGIEINQKHMYAYAMFGKDLFVNIHLSKIYCTKEDSVAMREILNGLRLKK